MTLVQLPMNIIAGAVVSPRFGGPPLTMLTGPNPVSFSVDLVRLAIFLHTGIWF